MALGWCTFWDLPSARILLSSCKEPLTFVLYCTRPFDAEIFFRPLGLFILLVFVVESAAAEDSEEDKEGTPSFTLNTGMLFTAVCRSV